MFSSWCDDLQEIKSDNKLEDVKLKNVKLTSQLESLCEDKSKLEFTIDQMKRNMDDLNEKLKESTIDQKCFDELKVESNLLRSQLNESNLKQEGLKSESDALISKLNELNDSKSKLQSKLNSVEEANVDLKSKLDSNRNSLEEALRHKTNL